MNKLFVFMIVFFIACNFCFSWNQKGHEIVARIAELNVKPETLLKINNILNGKTMVEVASWADGDVRTSRKETDHWHTTSIPAASPVTLNNITDFYPATENTLIYQLKKEISELKDKNLSFKQKKEYLMFLIHFVGDLHMPMHSAKYRTIHIEVPDGKKPMTLHNVWDNLLSIKDINKYAEELNNSITADEKKLWAIDNPDLWVFESFTIAKEKIYKTLPQNTSTMALPKSYKSDNAQIAKEQIKKAGIRLAMLLDKIFSE